MFRKLFVKLFSAAIFFGCLLCVTGAFGQTVTITSANSIATNGITSGDIVDGQTDVVLFGFTVQVTGSVNFTVFTLNGANNNMGGLFANGRLYRNTTGNTFEGAQIVNEANITIGNRDPQITGLNQTITNSTYTYFVVGNLTRSYGSLPATFRYSFDRANWSYSASFSGVSFSLVNASLTYASNNNGVTTQTSIYKGQTDVVIYGITVTTNGTINITSPYFNFATSASNNPLGYFPSGNLQLKMSTSGTYATATPVSATFSQSGNNLRAALSSTLTLNSGTSYTYYLVASLTGNSSLPLTFPINLSSIYSNNSSASYTNSASTSLSYNLKLADVSIADNNTTAAGIYPGSNISYGQTDLVLFGFALTVQGNLTISTMSIPSSNSMGQYFNGGKVYRSTDQYFNNAQLISGASINFNAGSQALLSGLNQTFTATSPTTYYYFITGDLKASISFTTPMTVRYNFTASQNPAAINSGTASQFNGFTTTQGKLFNIVGTYDWLGAQSNDFGDVRNFAPINGSAPVGSLPNASIVVNIGRIAYNASNPPAILSTTTSPTVAGITFGTAVASPSLSIASGKSITINNALNVLGSNEPTITGPGTVTLANTAVATMYSSSRLNLAGGITLSNAGIFNMAPTSTLSVTGSSTLSNSGTFTLKSDATSTASVAAIPSGSSLTGTYNVERYFTGGALSNRGWRLMSSPVNNTSTLPVNVSATSNFNSLKTNLIITGAGGSASGWDQPDGYTANGPTILFYDTTGSGRFTIPTALASTTSKAGQGFYFYFRGNNSNMLSKLVRTGGNFATPESGVVGLQSGTLNQQGFRYTLSNDGTGFNLVGNPYPSSITISSGNITGTTPFVYTYAAGGNSITTTAAPVSIASGQGFFLKSNATTSYIDFAEDMKTTGQPALLMSTASLAEKEGSIRLKMVQDSANYDFTQLRFSNNYNANYYDYEDADDLSANGQSVFLGSMTADNKPVAIASQPLLPKKTSVFLTVNNNSSGIFSLKKEEISNIPDKYDVWLVDHYKKDSLDLRANSTYNFNLDKTVAATYGTKRFEVVVRLKNFPPYKLVTFNGNRNAAGNILKWSTQNEYNYTYFELQKSLDSKTFEGVNNSISNAAGNYEFIDRTSEPLVYYRLKQTDINDVVTYSSVIVLKQETGEQVFSVFPNPVNNTLRFDIKQETKGPIKMSIYNSLGLIVKSSIFNSKTGQQNVSDLLPGTYTIELLDNRANKVVASTKFIKL